MARNACRSSPAFSKHGSVKFFERPPPPSCRGRRRAARSCTSVRGRPRVPATDGDGRDARGPELGDRRVQVLLEDRRALDPGLREQRAVVPEPLHAHAERQPGCPALECSPWRPSPPMTSSSGARPRRSGPAGPPRPPGPPSGRRPTAGTCPGSSPPASARPRAWPGAPRSGWDVSMVTFGWSASKPRATLLEVAVHRLVDAVVPPGQGDRRSPEPSGVAPAPPQAASSAVTAAIAAIDLPVRVTLISWPSQVVVDVVGRAPAGDRRGSAASVRHRYRHRYRQARARSPIGRSRAFGAQGNGHDEAVVRDDARTTTSRRAQSVTDTAVHRGLSTPTVWTGPVEHRARLGLALGARRTDPQLDLARLDHARQVAVGERQPGGRHREASTTADSPGLEWTRR